MGKQTACKEVYLQYKLHDAYGKYSKYGLITKETENEIHFITRSEKYRIQNEKHIERKQAKGWYSLGEVTELAVKKIEHKPTCYQDRD